MISKRPERFRADEGRRPLAHDRAEVRSAGPGTEPHQPHVRVTAR
jgi:hypothetical protein